jgi:Lrp/AsnC family leucine-responsive transcriptional regulator
MDATDRKILNQLYAQADHARKVTAKKVGLSEPSLSKKIANLRADGIIKNFSVNIDYARTGYDTHSVTLIRLHDQHRDKQTVLVEKISKINEAVEVYTVLGVWDIFVRWVCSSNARVMELVKNSILAEPGIDHIETITLGEEYKREFGPQFLEEKET